MNVSESQAVFDASPTSTPTSGAPTTVLFVDDSAFDRHLVGQLLGPLAELRLVYACNGREGLEVIGRESPAVVLTDLIMPDMRGLDLVQRIRTEYPHISVILVTAHGSEEIAMQALRLGAANYIPKKRLTRDLVPTVRHVLSRALITRERRRILQCLVRRESVFELDNDPQLILPLLKLLHEELEGLSICDAACQLQVGVALQEALYNAIFHGNLEVSSDLRQDDERCFDAMAAERRLIEPYRSRRVRLQVQLDHEMARFVVTDEGPGFTTSIFDRPVETDDLNRIGGRGLLLIRTFMSEVTFNETGNQITMIKLRSTK